MTERGIHTGHSLARDLSRLGLHSGDAVLVHSSLRALGFVPGGPVTVVRALQDVIGEDGTVVVPTQTPDNSDPAGWSRPPVPADWWPVIREHSPAYEPAIMPSRGMGALAEQVRTWPGSRRSGHPQTSFAALGARAEEVVAVHDLDSRCGERSPLATLERLRAKVLLLGAGFGSCTAFHLAEYRVPGASPVTRQGAAALGPDGRRAWLTWDEVELDEEDFVQIGEQLLTTGVVTSGRVGDAVAHLFDLARGVAVAAEWMAAHRVGHGS